MSIIIGFIIAVVLVRTIRIDAGTDDTHKGIFEVLEEGRQRKKQKAKEAYQLYKEEEAYEERIERPLDIQENDIDW